MGAAVLTACGGGHSPEQPVAVAQDAAPPIYFGSQMDAWGVPNEEAINLAAPIDYGMGPGVMLTSLSRQRLDVGPSTAGIPVGTPDAGAKGMFGDAFTWPIIPLHMVLLPDGRVLAYGSTSKGAQGGGMEYAVWNPTLGTGADAMQKLDNVTRTNVFCAGQSLKASGLVNILGGSVRKDGAANFGASASTMYDPAASTFAFQPSDMQYPRWYPTTVTLPQGDELVMGGRADRDPNSKGKSSLETFASTPEVRAEGGAWRSLTSATSEAAYGNARASWYYPRAWVAPNGKVAILAPQGDMYELDATGTGTIVRTLPPKLMNQGATVMPAVMYEPGKILALRKAAQAVSIDINGAAPVVTKLASLSQERQYGNATVLPTGEVWVNGGSSSGNSTPGAALHSEMWNPLSQSWIAAASATKVRLYHSASLLLPDGSVLTGGGGAPGPVIQLNGEVYYPPYLYKKDGSGEPAARPSITAAPTASTWGNQVDITVEPGHTISRVALIRFGAVTHAFGNDQRSQALDYTANGDVLTATLPASANVAPPGFYMLFVVDDQGVPSVARILRIS